MTSRVRRLLFRLLNAIRPGRSDPELEREIAAHLALLQDELARRGMTPDQARAAARRDLRHAGRLLRRDPAFTATAAVSLAIGIGANTTIFSVVNALLFQPPAGVVEPDRLVDIGSSRIRVGFGPTSYPNYLDV